MTDLSSSDDEVILPIMRRPRAKSCTSRLPPCTGFCLDAFTEPQRARLEALLADLDVREVTDRRAQIAIACKYLRGLEGDSRFTYKAIGIFFGLHGQAIPAQLRKSKRKPRGPGRPSLLRPDLVERTVDLIALRRNEHRPITYTELLDTLQDDHETVLSGDTLRHIRAR
jgi:hypothetical protein